MGPEYQRIRAAERAAATRGEMHDHDASLRE
jgi:hypothetical protein